MGDGAGGSKHSFFLTSAGLAAATAWPCADSDPSLIIPVSAVSAHICFQGSILVPSLQWQFISVNQAVTAQELKTQQCLNREFYF